MQETKWVYGTRTNSWHEVNNTDRDFLFGFSKDELNKIGKDTAKEIYLQAKII